MVVVVMMVVHYVVTFKSVGESDCAPPPQPLGPQCMMRLMRFNYNEAWWKTQDAVDLFRCRKL